MNWRVRDAKAHGLIHATSPHASHPGPYSSKPDEGFRFSRLNVAPFRKFPSFDE